MRTDGRADNSLRPIQIQTGVSEYAEGSVLIACGRTRVLCTATVEHQIPKWLQNQGQGWVTAEYGMLPRSTHTRISREKAANSGRTSEISRLVGRSLRAAVDLKALGERQIIVDCDVLQADGGTRTTAISGGFVALALAVQKLVKSGVLARSPIRNQVAAISCGILNQKALLDLNYEEDSGCETDMNFVMNSAGGLIEVQGTAEKNAFSPAEMAQMMELATAGCQQIFELQRQFVQV
jgi:ribonuclease PH